MHDVTSTIVCRLVLALWFLAFGLQAQAQAPQVLGPDIAYGVLVDSTGALSHHQVAALPDSAFEWRRTLFSEGYSPQTYWLRLHLPVESFVDGELWFEAFPPFLDDLRLFHRPRSSVDSPHSEWQTQQAGDRWPAAERPIRYRYFVFALPPSGPEGMDLLIRIQTSSALMLEGKFWSPPAFFNQASRSTALASIYLGMAIFASALAAAILFILRNRTLLAVFCLSVSYLYYASIQGFSQWLLFVGWPLWFVDQHVSVVNFMVHIIMLWVGREALQLPRFYPRLDRAYLALMGVMGLLSLSIPTAHYGQAIQFNYLLSEIGKIGLIMIAMRLWAKQGLEYGLIGLVCALLTFSSLSSMLSAAGLIPLIPWLFVLWQDFLVILMLVVMGISVYRVAQENKALRSKELLQKTLKIERDAGFRQRQFLGMVSHEFRSPLAVISLAAQNLSLDPPLDQDELDQRASKLLRATRRLVQLTDNCLEDARLGSQLQVLERQPCSLCRLIEEAAEIVVLSGTHQVSLSLNGQPVVRPANPIECGLDCDPALLRIALSNLLDNAVKYSPPGPIQLQLLTEPGQVQLHVISHGPPIPAALQSVIFERYVQGERAPDQPSRSGAGLGLFIAREIVRAHGGELSLLASTAHQTCFVIRLPTGAPEVRA